MAARCLAMMRAAREMLLVSALTATVTWLLWAIGCLLLINLPDDFRERISTPVVELPAADPLDHVVLVMHMGTDVPVLQDCQRPGMAAQNRVEPGVRGLVFGQSHRPAVQAPPHGADAGPVQRELQRPGGLSEPLPLGGVSLRDALVGVIRQDGDPATALGFPEAFPERFGLGFGEVTHGWRVVNGILGAVPIVSPLSRWPAHGCSRSRHETSPTAGMPSGQITVLPAVSPTGSPLTVTAGTGRGSG